MNDNNCTNVDIITFWFGIECNKRWFCYIRYSGRCI